MEYRSCHLHLHGVSIEENLIRNCCLTTPSGSETPILMTEYKAENIDWDSIFESKKKYIEALKLVEIPSCKGCYALDIKKRDDSKYISFINFNHWTNCNSRCIYCGVDKEKKNENKKIFASIKNLIDRGLFRNNGEITFQGGEPTLLDEFEDLVNLFIEQKARIRVHSSGILYSQAIANGLKDGTVTAVISPDSGTKNTYEKIKKVPCFDKVWDNITRYADYLNTENKYLLKTKYIIVPGYNDTFEEIENWLKLTEKAGVKSVIIDFEYTYTRQNINKISPHLYMLLDYVKHTAEKKGWEFSLYDSAVYAQESRIFKEKKFIMFLKPVYRFIIDKYKRRNTSLNIKHNWSRIVN